MSKHAPRGPVKAKTHDEGDPSKPRLKVLCTAHSSRTGKPCQRPPILGGTVCRTHGGAIQEQATAPDPVWAGIARLNCDCCVDENGVYMERWVLPEAEVLAALAAERASHQIEIARLKAEHAADLAEHWVPRFDLLAREREAFMAGYAAALGITRPGPRAEDRLHAYLRQRQQGVDFSSQSETPEG